jgi:non-ribosomal peptide synthetase component F
MCRWIPGHPDERIGFVFDDAGPVAVITSAELADRVGGAGVAVVDVADPQLAEQSVGPLPVSPHADDVAYVIYTSGTTGNAQGVCDYASRVLTQLVSAPVHVELGAAARSGVGAVSFVGV